jgi:hypothetical protein
MKTYSKDFLLKCRTLTMKAYTKDFLLKCRVFSSIIAVPFSLFAIADIIGTINKSEGNFMQDMNYEDMNYEGIIMTIVIFSFIVGYLISWINEGIGGSLMIFAGLLISIPLIIIDGNIGTLIFAIPFTGLGVMYVMYWDGKRKFKKLKPSD